MASVYLPQDYTTQISQIISPGFKGCGGLYLGNLEGSGNVQLLRKFGITAILSILSEKEIKITLKNISHTQIIADDHAFENVIQHFPKSIDFISKNLKRGNVFVHCVAGVSRSATIVIAYLMKTKKYRMEHALTKVKTRRNIINPNKGFMKQLQQFEKKLQSQTNIKAR